MTSDLAVLILTRAEGQERGLRENVMLERVGWGRRGVATLGRIKYEGLEAGRAGGQGGT